ncbi:hypothetical protein BDZ89DRAFT_1128352 [Hymenopellis radicata]|nr:hypothetical protein BDZ89DRAFT_1128352 [Hymenopellis radicata]
MKVVGNLSATEFFTKHGGSSLLNDADTRKKYSSRVAELYKEELARRVKEDATKFPQGIVVDGSKLGLGASKTKPVDFAAAEKKALEEAERTKQLGYDRQREEEEEKARKEAAAVKAALEIGPKSNYGSSTTTKSNPAADAQRAAAFPRLGFGAIPGTGAAAMAAAPAPAPKVADDSPTTARDKFGNQKAISYFGRNAYDPNTVAEAQTRLQSFQGATSISSNAYFGREEEEALPARDDDGLAARESAARDAMQRLMANPDVQNISDNIRTGALKLSDYLAQMSER